MAGNISPIFSKVGSIQGGVSISNTVTTADYTGVGIHNVFVYDADEVNGGFLQKLRFKALGTNGAGAVARIYINNGDLNTNSNLIAAAPTTTAASPSTTGGSLSAGTYYAKIQALDQFGAVGLAGPASLSTEVSATITGTGSSGSITWNWNAVTGAYKYRVFVGTATNAQNYYFEITPATTGTTPANTLVQTTAISTVGTDIKQGTPADFYYNNMFWGELSLPATTASTTAATVDIDYTMNIVLPPNHRILVGHGATFATPGWVCTGVGGAY